MKKIPSVFLRDEKDRSRLTDTPNPACAWVFDMEARPTRKWDGTCCLVREGRLFARYDAKHGKPTPPGFVPAQAEPDPVTGHFPGWLAVEEQPEYRWHRDAWARGMFADGTFELCGPKVNGNPEHFEDHHLISHGGISISSETTGDQTVAPFIVTYGNCVRALVALPWEGIVFYHPAGHVHGMAKIKRRDFGLPWPLTARR